jgi:hypothetical protein
VIPPGLALVALGAVLLLAVLAWLILSTPEPPTYLRAPCDDCGEDVWLDPVDDIAMWEREMST